MLSGLVEVYELYLGSPHEKGRRGGPLAALQVVLVPYPRLFEYAVPLKDRTE